jgi:hypothetical protein
VHPINRGCPVIKNSPNNRRFARCFITSATVLVCDCGSPTNLTSDQITFYKLPGIEVVGLGVYFVFIFPGEISLFFDKEIGKKKI